MAQSTELGTGFRIPAITDTEFARFRGLVLEQTGVQLSDRKRHLLVARLAQRLLSLGLETFSDYYEYLAHDPSGDELRDFISRVTTHKTSFFREPHHFEFLRSRLIPQIRAKTRAQGRTELRIWSAGCSTGEEPYSIAITVLEALGPLHDWDIRILASDVDTVSLSQAEAGMYAMESLEGVSEARRRAHFVRGYGDFEGLARVRPGLRQMIEFRRINLNEPDWGIHSRLDVIFCRNVIIYFDPGLQQRIVARLASHLQPEGYLFSGHSENLFQLRDLLVTVEPTVYRLRRSTDQS